MVRFVQLLKVPPPIVVTPGKFTLARLLQLLKVPLPILVTFGKEVLPSTAVRPEQPLKAVSLIVVILGK